MSRHLRAVELKYPLCYEKFNDHLSQGCANDLLYYLEVGHVAKDDLDAVFETLLIEKQNHILSQAGRLDAIDLIEKYPTYRHVIKGVCVRGQKFGNAIATGYLSEGGMGDIYQGYLPFGKVRRKCVIKVTRQDTSSAYDSGSYFSQESIEDYRIEVKKRFERELEITAFVGKNPRVVQAYSAGSFSSSSGHEENYLTMEFVNGLNLLELKKRYELEQSEPLPAAAVCEIIYQVAKGLSGLHTKIIHRDIKPQNLMVVLKGHTDESNLVRILDFGIAHVKQDAQGIGNSEVGASFVTNLSSESYKGTPHYSPHEQFIDTSLIDQTADLYALGCTMFQLLNEKGLPPFPSPLSNADDFKKLRDAHWLNKVPELKRSDCCSTINRIIQKLTHKKIASRYPSAKELMNDLETLRKPIELQNVINRLNGEEEIAVAAPPVPIWKRLNPFSTTK